MLGKVIYYATGSAHFCANYAQIMLLIYLSGVTSSSSIVFFFRSLAAMFAGSGRLFPRRELHVIGGVADAILRM